EGAGLLEQALGVSQTAYGEPAVGAHLWIGHLLRRIDADKALAHASTAVDLANLIEPPSPALVADTRFGRARVLIMLGHDQDALQDALQDAQQVVGLAESAGDAERLGSGYLALAEMSLYRMEYAAALSWATEAGRAAASIRLRPRLERSRRYLLIN